MFCLLGFEYHGTVKVEKENFLGLGGAVVVVVVVVADKTLGRARPEPFLAVDGLAIASWLTPVS